MFNSVLISGPIVLLAGTLLIIGLFSYLKSEPLSLHMARNQLKTGCAITLSFLESAYITNYLERFISLVFPTIGSPVLLGILLLMISLTGFTVLFKTAKKDISSRKLTVHQAQKKYFGYNSILVFTMYHYAVGIIILVFFYEILYFPWLLDAILPHAKNSPTNIEVGQFILVIILIVIPFLLIVFTPLSLKKLLGNNKMIHTK